MKTDDRAGSLWTALAVFGASLLLNYWCGLLADRNGALGASEPDLILGYLPVVDLRPIFVWGYAAFIIWAMAVCLARERGRWAYILWSYAALISVRSFFIVLTPMRHPLGALKFGTDAINPATEALFHLVGRYLTFGNDLFFSSHTAMPFLGYLIFRGRWIRLSFLGLSVLLASTVLLIRVHYSIDVAGAYFITYSVHRLGVRWASRTR